MSTDIIQECQPYESSIRFGYTSNDIADVNGIPLKDCLMIGMPFVVEWVLKFFNSEYMGIKKRVVFNRNLTDSRCDRITEDNLSSITYIADKVKSYIANPESRFDPILIWNADWEISNVLEFNGTNLISDANDMPNANLLIRPYTWTDIFYRAAVDALSNKKIVYIRYPVFTCADNLHITEFSVLSTNHTCFMEVNNKIYHDYPCIDIRLSKKETVEQFVDTRKIDIASLIAIGGDVSADVLTISLVDPSKIKA